MLRGPDRSYGIRATPLALGWVGLVGMSVLGSGAAAFVLAGAIPIAARAQQAAAAASSLVFDGVTVVDVEHGKLLSAQRVVIAGNRIQAVGNVDAVKLPKGTQVVDARGKYLIPGLWDMHTHVKDPLVFPLFLANGVTGIRDAGSQVSLDTFRQWRRETWAGTRVGPPRMVLSGRAIDEKSPCERSQEKLTMTCVTTGDTADARHLVDSLVAAGTDMIKLHEVSTGMYFTDAAAARRAGVRIGGHAENVSASDVSDSGVSIIDHAIGGAGAGGLDTLCFHGDSATPGAQQRQGASPASVEQCRPIAERLRRNGTWAVLTAMLAPAFFVDEFPPRSIPGRLNEFVAAFRTASTVNRDWLRDTARVPTVPRWLDLSVAERSGLPILAGTDLVGPGSFSINGRMLRSLAGFSLQAELALDVEWGLTPLAALQTATLNPAKFLHATDSLGTVAPGKLADLVLLDANPLADITNTTMIRAVVANGRYFDRAAVDGLVAEVQAKVKQEPEEEPTEP